VKNCPKCGGQNPDGVGVCRSCGSPIKGPGLLARLFGRLGRAGTAGQGETPMQEPPKLAIRRRNGTIPAASLSPEARRTLGEIRQQAPIRVTKASSTPVSLVTITEGGVTHTYSSWDEVPAHLRDKHKATGEEHGTAAGTQITIEASGERRTYGSIEEVPPEYRALVEDLPLQTHPAGDGPITVTQNGVTHTYNSWEDMPPELREKYREIVAAHGGVDAPRERITVEVNGERRTYDSIEDVPPELRARIEAFRRIIKERGQG